MILGAHLAMQQVNVQNVLQRLYVNVDARYNKVGCFIINVKPYKGWKALNVPRIMKVL
jgi:hypothetical protein